MEGGAKEYNKNESLRDAGKEFAEKARGLQSLLEIAIIGSVAGNDPYPNDIDLAVIVRSLEEIEALAKYARQISRRHNSWDVFLFDEKLIHLGRICHRKECPAQSVDCTVPGCGKPPHLRILPEFEYNERTFLESPIDVLWAASKNSRFAARRDELKITETRKYPVMADIRIECMVCGKEFIFNGGEQKWYKKRGLSQPKRCPDCRGRMPGP